MVVLEDDEILEPVSAPAPPSADDGWRTDKNGNRYVPRDDGRSGVIRRQGDQETVDEARERDSKPKDSPPRTKAKKPKMPPAPKKVDLRLLEEGLSGALKAPGAVAMSFGDEWGFEHFNISGPYLARQLVLASEFNPWLRKRLEEAAAGEEVMMKIMGLMGIAGALVGYLVPPLIYYLNLPVPEQARSMWHVPPRKERTPDYAATPSSPSAAGDPFEA